MSDDAELLRRYSEEKSQEAFAELVRRHLGLVYHAALRQLGGDAHRAEDVAQLVFTDLARKAGELARRPVLASWLFTSTRFSALQVVRGERRRQAREQELYAMSEISSEPTDPADWEQMRPVIDDVLNSLGETDREAVLLRFFEGRPFAEVGERIAVSADAARVRVDRALEKMRGELARRGVTSSTAALATLLASQAAAAAPAGLAATITGTALGGAAAAGIGVAATFMTMNKLIWGTAAAVVAAGATGFVVQARTNAELREELTQLRTQNQEVAALQAENLRLAKTAAEVEAMRADDVALAQLNDEADTLKTRMQASVTRSAQVAAARTIYEVTKVDRLPRPTKQVRPQYPSELGSVGVDGEVVVDFVVDSQGNVRNAYAAKSSQREFEESAVTAVSQWKFEAGLKGGRAINTHMQVPIVYKLAKGEATPGEPHPVGGAKKP